jgi:hypothetical protein
MSFAEARIKEYRLATESKQHPVTEVRFADAQAGGLRLVIVSKDRRLTDARAVSEEEIKRQLAEEGLIRLPIGNQMPAGDFKRINVGGKPVSEMIIEERR